MTLVTIYERWVSMKSRDHPSLLIYSQRTLPSIKPKPCNTCWWTRVGHIGILCWSMEIVLPFSVETLLSSIWCPMTPLFSFFCSYMHISCRGRFFGEFCKLNISVHILYVPLCISGRGRFLYWKEILVFFFRNNGLLFLLFLFSCQCPVEGVFFGFFKKNNICSFKHGLHPV
jgi:hypothetical protein